MSDAVPSLCKVFKRGLEWILKEGRGGRRGARSRRRDDERRVADERFFVLAEFRTREQAVVATHGELQAQAQAVMDVISNPEVVSALRQDKLHNLAYLKDNHSVRSAFLLPPCA